MTFYDIEHDCIWWMISTWVLCSDWSVRSRCSHVWGAAGAGGISALTVSVDQQGAHQPSQTCSHTVLPLAAGRPIRVSLHHRRAWAWGRGFMRRAEPIRGVPIVKSCWWEEGQSSASTSWEPKDSTSSDWMVRSLTSRHVHWPQDAFTDLTSHLLPVDRLRCLKEEKKKRSVLRTSHQQVHRLSPADFKLTEWCHFLSSVDVTSCPCRWSLKAPPLSSVTLLQVCPPSRYMMSHRLPLGLLGNKHTAHGAWWDWVQTCSRVSGNTNSCCSCPAVMFL